MIIQRLAAGRGFGDVCNLSFALADGIDHRIVVSLLQDVAEDRLKAPSSGILKRPRFVEPTAYGLDRWHPAVVATGSSYTL